MYYVIYIFVLIYSLSVSYAQNISIETVLQSTENDDRVVANRQKAIFGSGLDYRLPFLKKIDLRLGFNGNGSRDTLDGFFRNEDYYAISFTPNIPRERKLQTQIQTAQNLLYNTEYQLLIQQSLSDRYMCLVSLFYGKKILDERLKLRGLYEKKNNLLRLMIENSLDIKIKDITDVEIDKGTLNNVIVEVENTLATQTIRLKQLLKQETDLNIDFQNFISPTKVASFVENINKNTIPQLPQTNYRAAQIGVSEAEFALENIQNRQIFSFFQVGYNRSVVTEAALKRFNPSNNLAFRVGLTAPLSANNNLKRSEAALQLKSDELNAQLTAQLLSKSIDIQRVRLENILKSYNITTQNMNESLIPKLLGNATITAQIQPMELIELQIAQQKLNIRNTEISNELTLEYIRFLDISGALYQFRGNNFLK